MPHVLDAVGVPAIRRGIERLDHGPVVGHDLTPRCRDRVDPPTAVGSGFPVVSDVGLVPRPVGEMAVAIGPDPVVPHRIDGVRARSDGLGLHGLHRPRSGNLAEAVEVALEPEPSDQPLDAPAGAGARREVELDRPAGVGEPVVPDRVGLRDEHASTVVGVGQEQVPRGRPPGVPADQRACRVADRVRPLRAPHGPRGAGPDRSDQPAGERRPDPQSNPMHLSRQVDEGSLRGESDTDVRRERRRRIHPGPAVEVGEDLPVPPPHVRETVRAPLRHPEAVAVTRTVERERPARSGGHRNDGKRQRADRSGHEEHAEASSHRSGSHPHHVVRRHVGHVPEPNHRRFPGAY